MRVSAILVRGRKLVPSRQWQAMLQGYGRDPEIIVRDWPPRLGKFGLDLTVVLGGGMVRKQKRGRCQKVIDLSMLFLSPLRSLCAKAKFANHHPRNIQGFEFCKPRSQCLIATKVCNHG